MPIGNYIVDFACYKAALIIELDGGQHTECVEYDEMRTGFLERQGWLVLRFWNNDFRNNEEGVLLTILRHLQTLTPALSRREREREREKEKVGDNTTYLHYRSPLPVGEG